MTLRQKLKAIVRCEELCSQHKQVKLQITDDPESISEQEGKPLAQDASLDNLHKLRAAVSKAMENKNFKNCVSVGNSTASLNAPMFYLFAVYG